MADQLVEPREADRAPDAAAPGGNGSHDDGSNRAQTTAGSRSARWRERRRGRVSRWDRPPEPKDWRFLVGTLGKVLIVTGLLMFGFVAYQLWGTGIETALAQRELADEFEDRLDEVSTTDEPAVGFDSWVAPDDPTPNDTTLDDTASAPADSEVADDPVVEPEVDDQDDAGGAGDAGVPGIGAVEPIGAASDAVPGGVDLSDYAVDQDVPVVPGESFARLEIDAIGVDDYIVPGVTLNDLKKGPGHFGSTPLPGQLGNASIAGHRTTYGAPFFDLDQLEPGDDIVITMVTGDRFVYRVTGSEVVTAADTWVITTRDPSVAELTLTTCDPKYTARNRLIIHSVLVPELSSQVGEAEFYDDGSANGEGDDPIPGDDPTFDTEAAPDAANAESPAEGDVEADDAADQPTADADAETSDADDAADQSVDETSDPSAADATPDQSVDDATPTDGDAAEPAASGAPIDPDAEIDAFSEGWFDDSGAWPQIALWGLVLILIAVGAYQLAKWRRNLLYAFAVGTVPFLVGLYFFYQNVNRLLPPGL